MRALLALLLMFGCVDAPRSDAVDPSPDAGVEPPACVDDRHGFGTEALPAVRMAVGDGAELVVCPPAADWIGIDAPAGRIIAAAAEADRPVRLRLGDAESALGRRVVIRGAIPPGGATLAVEAADAAAAVPYRLTVTGAVDDCDDGFEPNDNPSDATPLAGRLDGVVCSGDADVYLVAGPPGAAVRVGAQVVEGQGIGLASAVDFDGSAVPVEQAVDPQAPSLERRLNAAGRAFFRVTPVGAGARYRLEAVIEPSEVVMVARAGEVRVPDRPVTVNGLGAWTDAPRGGVLVDALVDGVLAAATRTDAEGQWGIEIAAPPDAIVDVRVRASVWSDGKLITVGPSAERAWAAPADGTLDVDGAVGPALHIAATATDGVARLRPFLSVLRQQPPLRIVWRPGAAEACGTCFRPADDVVALSGRLTDPDEWDDAIILHELVHHLALHHGRDDSPGGAHDGRPVAPALAWSEGFATAIAAWLLDTPRVLDARATGVRETELETMDDPQAFGTADGTAAGAVSEYLVAAVLWDALDDTSEDPIELGPAVVIEAGFGGLATRAVDAGAPGMDLLDHSDEMACRAEPAITPLLEAREVPAVARCRNKPGTLLVTTPSGFQAGCTGVAQADGRVWPVRVGDIIETNGPARLDCGAVREYADPPRRAPLRSWRVRAGAAQLD